MPFNTAYTQRPSARALLCSTALATAMLALSVSPAQAQSVSTSGDVNPTPSPNPTPDWDLGSSVILEIGDTGTGTMEVEEGGTVSNGYTVVGNHADAVGTVIVTGSNSKWTSTVQLVVGHEGRGALTISDGGAVVGAGFMGLAATGQGTVTVTGDGSRWTSTRISVGYQGTGVLNIDSGGTVSTPLAEIGYRDAGAHGTVNLHGIAGARGVLETEQVLRGPGTGILNFDGGILRAVREEADFLSGFESGEAIIDSGGAFIDSQYFVIGIGAELQGSGRLTKTGVGELTLTGANRYTGGTTIADGILRLGDGGTSGSIVGDVVNDDTLVFNRSDDVTFGGVISGSGYVHQSGTGTTTLTGINSYGGETLVQAGELHLAAGGQITATSKLNIAYNSDQVASVTVDGVGSRVNVGGLLGVQIGNNGEGTLNVVNGGAVEAASLSVGTFEHGTLNVVGAGSSLITSTSDAVFLGFSGTGVVNILGGGYVQNAGDVSIAVTDGQGIVTVSGENSRWNIGNQLNLQRGSLSVGDGGIVNANDIVISRSAFDSLIYDGRITVSGAGSALTSATNFMIADDATAIGALTIADGGAVTVGGGTLALGAGDAALNIGGAEGAAAIGAGVLNATDVTMAAATNRINFNHTDTAYMFGAAISGAGAINQTGRGTTVLTADNSYTGGTTISAGTLQLGDGGMTGSIVGDVVNDGRLVINRNAELTFAGVISGSGAIELTGSNGVVLTGENSYTGGTTISGGMLVLGNNGTTGSIVGDVLNNSGIWFRRSNSVTFDGTISGTGFVRQHSAGTTILTGDNSYTGTTRINSGTLIINGDQSAATGTTSVFRDARLGGTGIIGGDVSILDGGVLAPGESPGTLTINGNLSLVGGSILDFEFGEAGVVGGALNDLVNVGGDLTLDGTINVSVPTGGSFDAGIYRVFNFGGALTDNGLELGVMPDGSSVVVQTSTTGQVNLVNSAGLNLNFWDGDVGPKFDGTANGGNGTWQNGTGNDNWTDSAGLVNAGYTDGAFAIFAGLGGTVTVDNGRGAVSASGMQFATDGYGIGGGDIALVGPQSTIRVGDGTAAGAGITATITSVLTGATQLVKSDLGMLVLVGANAYTGGTQIDEGTLQVSADANLGAGGGSLGIDGATLQTTGAFVTDRDVVLGAGGGTFRTDAGLRVDGTISGSGTLTKTGGADLRLATANTYSGGTVINEGGITAMATGALGTGPVTVSDAALSFRNGASAGDLVIGNTRSNINFYDTTSAADARFTIDGEGLSFNGSSTAENAAIAVGSGGSVDFYNNSSAGAATVTGTDGHVRFHGNSTADGATIANDLNSAVEIHDLASDGIAIGSLSGAGAVMLGAKTLTLGGLGLDDALSGTIQDGLVGSGGRLVKEGAGTLILAGTNSYTGGTAINGGTVRIAADANFGAATGGLSFDGGTLHTTADITSSRAVDLVGAGTLDIDSGTTLALGGAIAGAGGFAKHGDGTLILAGTNSYGGTTTVGGGTLLVNGDQSGATGLTSVALGATLGGTGIIGGDVAVLDGGTLAPGESPGTLTIDGNLALASGVVLDFEFGEAGVAGGALNDLVNVGGDLTLDGTIEVSVPSGGDFGPGIYRVFNYGGMLTDNGLELGTVPGGSAVSVQTAIDGQVNLVNTAGLTLSFWDGTAGPKNDGLVDGGDGVWRAGGGGGNWTDSGGAVNADYAQDSFAIFSAAPGTVTVDNSGGDVLALGMQFASDGYVIAGGPLTLTGTQAIVQVGDSSAAGAGYIATIDAALTGTARLVKTDAGTLVLTGTNTFAGGTAINGGTLRIASDANLGDAAGGLSFDGGTLNTTADITSGRAVELVGAGTVLTDAGTTLTLSGVTSGVGELTKRGAGTLVLAGAGSNGGGINVGAGTLLVNGDFAGASGAVVVTSGATLGGMGIIGGDVTLGDGATLAPGSTGAGTLTVNGDLSLASGSRLAFELGEADVAGGALNDLVIVGGDLALDGTLDVAVTAGGAFDIGVYRLFDYGGTLTDNGLTLGILPPESKVSVQTAIAGQVNLVNAPTEVLKFWDGAAGPKNDGVIAGGDGTWQGSSGNDNWTDATGATNAAYADEAFAIFGGTGGTVTVDDSLGAVTARGLQFMADGYTVTGDAITLSSPESIVRVGDGTTAGAALTSTIESALAGDTRLVKTDAGTLVLTGANSYNGGTTIAGGTLVIASDANLGDAAGDLTLDGGRLMTSADLSSARDIILASAGTIAAQDGTVFTYEGQFSGPGALTKDGAGQLVVTGDNAAFVSDVRVTDGTLTVEGSLGGAVNIAASGHLGGSGRVGGITNSGVVAPGSSIGTLTVAGDYVGDGGVLEVEAELGGDNSPADRLVVEGATSGSTLVTVTNLGGLGGATVEGIKIVDVGGASDGTFALDGDYAFGGEQVVIAGAYGYRLARNGIADPADGDWYLRSAAPGAGGPNGPAPLYQPGVPVYEAYVGALQALNGLPTLQQRVGNRSWAGARVVAGTGIWGRMQAKRQRPDAAFSTSSADRAVDSWQMQMGTDIPLHQRADGAMLIGGLTAHYGTADSEVTSRFGNGTIDTKGYGFGATLTWFGPKGFYLDGQAKLSWFESDLESSVLGSLVEGSDGTGQAYSLEAGKRAQIGRNLTITPQIQMSYANVDFDSFVDPVGAAVSSDRGDSLRSRWGFSIDHQTSSDGASGDRRRTHLYTIVNLSYEWLEGALTDVSSTSITQRDSRLWGELGLGGSYSWGDGRFALFAEVSGESAIADFGDSYSVEGNAGIRVRF